MTSFSVNLSLCIRKLLLLWINIVYNNFTQCAYQMFPCVIFLSHLCILLYHLGKKIIWLLTFYYISLWSPSVVFNSVKTSSPVLRRQRNHAQSCLVPDFSGLADYWFTVTELSCWFRSLLSLISPDLLSWNSARILSTS